MRYADREALVNIERAAATTTASCATNRIVNMMRERLWAPRRGDAYLCIFENDNLAAARGPLEGRGAARPTCATDRHRWQGRVHQLKVVFTENALLDRYFDRCASVAPPSSTTC
ncbi:MAG: hypothetical protein U1F67_15155 [Rubrivivax sp.]